MSESRLYSCLQKGYLMSFIGGQHTVPVHTLYVPNPSCFLLLNTRSYQLHNPFRDGKIYLNSLSIPVTVNININIYEMNPAFILFFEEGKRKVSA